MSLPETDHARVIAWRRNAKGRPTRWRILRDLVALVSLHWMTTEQVQVGMRRLWALKNKTTRDMIEELESEGTLHQSKDEKTNRFMWHATQSGVAFWITSPNHIPAGLVEVASTIKHASQLELL